MGEERSLSPLILKYIIHRRGKNRYHKYICKEDRDQGYASAVVCSGMAFRATHYRLGPASRGFDSKKKPANILWFCDDISSLPFLFLSLHTR